MANTTDAHFYLLGLTLTSSSRLSSTRLRLSIICESIHYVIMHPLPASNTCAQDTQKYHCQVSDVFLAEQQLLDPFHLLLAHLLQAMDLRLVSMRELAHFKMPTPIPLPLHSYEEHFTPHHHSDVITICTACTICIP